MPGPPISATFQIAIRRRSGRSRVHDVGAETQRSLSLRSEQTRTEQSEGELVSARVDFGKGIPENAAGLASCGPLGFSHASAFALGRLLVVRVALHVTNQTLFFAELLEAPDHLLHRLACTHLDFQHSMDSLKRPSGHKPELAGARTPNFDVTCEPVNLIAWSCVFKSKIPGRAAFSANYRPRVGLIQACRTPRIRLFEPPRA
jgi:hypothetical protein